MTEAVGVVQRTEGAMFTIAIYRAEDGYEYEVRDCAQDVTAQDAAEALFSATLDIHAKGLCPGN